MPALLYTDQDVPLCTEVPLSSGLDARTSTDQDAWQYTDQDARLGTDKDGSFRLPAVGPLGHRPGCNHPPIPFWVKCVIYSKVGPGP